MADLREGGKSCRAAVNDPTVNEIVENDKAEHAVRIVVYGRQEKLLAPRRAAPVLGFRCGATLSNKAVPATP